jgi:hypothetical protein
MRVPGVICFCFFTDTRALQRQAAHAGLPVRAPVLSRFDFDLTLICPALLLGMDRHLRMCSAPCTILKSTAGVDPHLWYHVPTGVRMVSAWCPHVGLCMSPGYAVWTRSCPSGIQKRTNGMTRYMYPAHTVKAATCRRYSELLHTR